MEGSLIRGECPENYLTQLFGTPMPSNQAPKINPLLPPDWNEEILDALGAFPGSLNFVMGKWAEQSEDQRGLNTLGMFAHYPELAKAFMTLNSHVAANSSLPVRERELLILRTSWLVKSEYEFVQHLILGRRAGLSEAELERIQLGPKAEGWSSDDAELISVADDLYHHTRVSDATFAKLATRFSNKEIMDMIFLVGSYTVLAMGVGSFDITMESGLEPLPEETRARMFAQAK